MDGGRYDGCPRWSAAQAHDVSQFSLVSCLVREGLCFCNLPLTTRNPLSIHESRDLILFHLWTSWPFSRHLISSPKASTCAFFTSWLWAALKQLWAVPSLLVYCFQVSSRTPALVLVQLGTNIFSIPTQFQEAQLDLSQRLVCIQLHYLQTLV